jgi:hypothetical protein
MPAQDSYKMPDAAKAAGIPHKDLTRHLGRKVIKFPDSDPGKGHQRRCSLDSIYMIAIGHALIKAFVSPTTAMSLAQLFFEPQCGRTAGKPFVSGKTLLLVTDGIGSVINLEADQDILTHLKEATIVVDICSIVSTVNARLLN